MNLLEQLKSRAYVEVQWDVYLNGSLSATIGPAFYSGEDGGGGGNQGADFGENLASNFSPGDFIIASSDSDSGDVYTTEVTMTHHGEFLPMRWDFTHQEFDMSGGGQVGGDIDDFFQLSGASSTKTFSVTNANCSAIYSSPPVDFTSPG